MRPFILLLYIIFSAVCFSCQNDPAEIKQKEDLKAMIINDLMDRLSTCNSYEYLIINRNQFSQFYTGFPGIFLNFDDSSFTNNIVFRHKLQHPDRKIENDLWLEKDIQRITDSLTSIQKNPHEIAEFFKVYMNRKAQLTMAAEIISDKEVCVHYSGTIDRMPDCSFPFTRTFLFKKGVWKVRD